MQFSIGLPKHGGAMFKVSRGKLILVEAQPRNTMQWALVRAYQGKSLQTGRMLSTRQGLRKWSARG